MTGVTLLELLVTDCKLDDQESISSIGRDFSLRCYAQADVGLSQPVVSGFFLGG
jgi:hypothetical protein